MGFGGGSEFSSSAVFLQALENLAFCLEMEGRYVMVRLGRAVLGGRYLLFYLAVRWSFAYLEMPMMVSAIFAGECVDVDFNLDLPRSVTADKELSRRGLLSTEFGGAVFSTN